MRLIVRVNGVSVCSRPPERRRQRGQTGAFQRSIDRALGRSGSATQPSMPACAGRGRPPSAGRFRPGESMGVLNCPPSCPATHLRVTGTDTGEATHLGHFSAAYEDEVDLRTAAGTRNVAGRRRHDSCSRDMQADKPSSSHQCLDHHLGGHDHARDGSVRRSHRDVYDHTHRHR